LFFESKLENVLSHDRNRWEKIGKDAERYRKIGKDTKRWGKIAAVSENAGFHVLPTCMYSLTAGSPT